jgi:hypothetical protein
MDSVPPPLPSPGAQTVLRAHGWSPERDLDISEWADRLRSDGNEVFPIAAAILRNFGGLHVKSGEPPTGSRFAFDIDPSSWFQERELVQAVEEVIGARACPLGEAYGGAMLAVLEDGRIIADLSGDIAMLGDDLPAALDLLILGQGAYRTLARNYVPVSNQQSQPS